MIVQENNETKNFQFWSHQSSLTKADQAEHLKADCINPRFNIFYFITQLQNATTYHVPKELLHQMFYR